MLDGKFFLVEKCAGKMHVEALCQLCVLSKKIIKGSVESTTNFVKHLKRVHGEKSYNDYVKYKEKIKSGKGKAKGDSDPDTTTIMGNSAVKRSKQGTLKKFVHQKKSGNRRNSTKKSLISLLIQYPRYLFSKMKAL